MNMDNTWLYIILLRYPADKYYFLSLVCYMSTGEKLINDGSNAVLSLEDFLLRYAIVALFSKFPNFFNILSYL